MLHAPKLIICLIKLPDSIAKSQVVFQHRKTAHHAQRVGDRGARKGPAAPFCPGALNPAG